MHDCYILYELCLKVPQQSVGQYAERRVNLSSRYLTLEERGATDPD